MNPLMKIEGTRIRGGNQIPAISSVARDIFDTPTAFRVKSLSPNCSNSLKTLSSLNVQTYATDSPTVTCKIFIRSSIFLN